MTTHDDSSMEELYTAWCVAEFEADCIYDELDEDFTHPRFIEASRQSRELLFGFLNRRTTSLRHVLLKLQVACDVEDYLTDALNAANSDIAPRAVVGAMQDLECLTMAMPMRA